LLCHDGVGSRAGQEKARAGYTRLAAIGTASSNSSILAFGGAISCRQEKSVWVLKYQLGCSVTSDAVRLHTPISQVISPGCRPVFCLAAGAPATEAQSSSSGIKRQNNLGRSRRISIPFQSLIVDINAQTAHRLRVSGDRRTLSAHALFWHSRAIGRPDHRKVVVPKCSSEVQCGHVSCGMKSSEGSISVSDSSASHIFVDVCRDMRKYCSGVLLTIICIQRCKSSLSAAQLF